ncbi:MAG: hypothetical protein J6B87_03505 [Clostridia bacterium]|nr:hypothetical protein [Clostridia bacterium]
MRENKIIKACNFYVSEWHLFAALLPHLKEELEKKNEIIIISQDNLEKGIKELVERINIKFENNKGLNEITWLSKEFVLEIREDIKPLNIVIQGTIQFIEEVNNYLKENIINIYREVRIIDCYEIYDSNTMLYNILDNHEYVFNTGGMHDKNDIFPEYGKAKASAH